MAKAFRVVLDEPVGICVGFKPKQTDLNMDEYELLSDDKGSNVFILDGKIVVSKSGDLHNYEQTQYPEPDLLIWRTPDEFNEWYDENVG